MPTIPEIVAISIALLSFVLLLVITVLRFRSRESDVFYLSLFIVLGLASSLSLLMSLLAVTPLTSNFSYKLGAEFALLAMVLSFGVLTLNFLRKPFNSLVVYGVVGLAVLGSWIALAFNISGLSNLIPNLAIGEVRYSPLLALDGIGWLLAVFTVLIALSASFKKHRSPQYLNRLRYWLIATILLGASGLVWFGFRDLFNWAGLSSLVVGSILAAYTVLSYQTPDLKLLIGRALRYIGVTVIIASVFFVGLAVAVTISRNESNPTNVLFWSIIVAIVVAIFFPVMWPIANRLLTRIVFGKQLHNEKKVIQHYSQSISSALDMKRLGDTVINLMIETLGIERGIVFVNDRGQAGEVALRPLSSIGMVDLTTGHFATDSPFIDHFREGSKSLSQYDTEVLPEFRSMSADERRWLNSLGMELFVPILRQRELVGMLAFGPQPQGTAYYDEDLDLMTALADQTALAMDSARLFEQLAIVNQEVGQLTEQLAGLDQTKSDFLSIASHELRTPLTHIHGYSRMLLDITDDELRDPSYIKTLIEGVVKGSERMKDVVDLMFDVTEANVGAMPLFTGPVNLREVIDQATRPYLSAMDDRRIAFGKEGINDLPIVEADGTRLVQAFDNLVGNAIKYTPDGGTIKVTGRPVLLDDIGSAVEIVVADTGIGIDPEHHDRIFEKFFRVGDTLHHSTGRTKFKGAGPGLGLTLVKGIAESHGGKVWVESLGQDEVNCPGSKFYFVMPLHASMRKHEIDEPRQSDIVTRQWRRRDFVKED